MKAVEWLINIFKIKSPCCKKPMKDIGLHQFWGGGENIIYELKNVKSNGYETNSSRMVI